MSGPAWIADALAVVMIVTAVYCVSRIATARRRRRPTEYDVDGVHVVMGVAMAGMLVPRLSLVGGGAWAVVFGGAAAWFGAQTVRGYRRRRREHRSAHHVPHLLASGAMLYMVLALPAAGAAAGRARVSMGAGPSAGFPALALVLALALIGYVIWTTDRLTSLAPVAAAGTQVRAVTAPPMSLRLAACCDIVMGLTMGYTLILML
jgi:Domain of unknown function (DUF5134)